MATPREPLRPAFNCRGDCGLSRRVRRVRALDRDPMRARRRLARQCVFIGTTNESAYLHDETGGRRFWPVKTGTIDHQGLARDRDQLFAEAVAAYRDGLQWWPDREFEQEHLRPIQDARFEADPWEEPIAQFLSTKTRVLVGEIALEALEMKLERVSKGDNLRITAILRRLDWRRSETKIRGHFPWIRLQSRPFLRLVA
jgi:predicted P-loop ATPase